MDTVKQAVGSLREVEKKLRRFLAEAAVSGDYAGVVQLAAWARSISGMLKDVPAPYIPSTDESLRVQGSAASQVSKATKRIAAHRELDDGYPRFFRQQDRLFRVGWSKREKREYEHNARHSVLRTVSQAMAEKGQGGRVFSMDEILEVSKTTGEGAPSYQAYVALAFLKHAGLVDQHGRRGYSIPRLEQFGNEVEAVWQNLPQK